MAVDNIDVRSAAGCPVLVDVREQDEWDQGHAPAARHLPMSSFDASGLPLDGQIAVICRAGGRSAQVAAHLDTLGYDVVNVAGGMLAWQAAGMSVVTPGGDPGSVSAH